MSTHKNIDIICIAAILSAIVLTALLMSGGFGSIPAVNAEGSSDYFTANDLNGDWDTSSATKITLSDSGSTIAGNGAYVHDGNVYIVYGGHYVLTGALTDGSVVINADKSDKIWIALENVTLHCEDDAAIRVEQADKVFLTLADGTENTLSSGPSYNAEAGASGVDGVIYSRDDLTINGTGALTVNAAYYHGIVCNDDLAITGGNLTISAVQDGIHANDSVRIRDAAISVSAGDDGITVSNDDETAFLYIESGEITIPACYEGLEAIEIIIAGGTFDIWPTDDGINANGSGESSVIRITGGDITITNPSGRDADGLDSNGSIYVEGGSVFISVTGAGGNSALDYGIENGGECIVSGGTVIACGGSMMAEGFDADSPQGFLMYTTSAAAGATVSLADSSGEELLSAEIPCSFSSVVISTPQMKIGDICTIEIDGAQEQITIDNQSSSGFSPAGMFGGGMRDGRGRAEMENGQENRGDPPSAGRGDGGRPEDMTQAPPPENGQAFPDKQGMEPPENSQDSFPEHDPAIFPNDSEPSKEPEFPGGMEHAGRTEIPDEENRPDGQEIREAGGRALTSDTKQMQSTLILVGASFLVLLIGLLIAVKIRH